MFQAVNTYKNQITFISGALILLGFISEFAGYKNSQDTILIAATVIASVPIFIKAYPIDEKVLAADKSIAVGNFDHSQH